MKDRMKKLKRGIIVLSGFALIVPIATAILYERVGTKNGFIVLSKRFVAETANLAVRFYDPYKSKIKKAILSPSYPSQIIQQGLLDTEEEILDFISSDKFLKEHLKLSGYENGNITSSRFEFFYQPEDEPSLGILHDRFALDEVIRNGRDDFDKLLNLARWVNRQWKYGIPRNVPFNFNAIELLERAKKGERFFCSEYAVVFIQCALSLGFQARYAGLANHVVSEVWLDDYRKWVMLDPTFCIYIRHRGVPLNCLEIHNILIEGKINELEIVEFGLQGSLKISKEKLFKNYKKFYIRMRNDWFTNKLPHWYPLSNSVMNGVEWVDYATQNSMGIARETSLKNDLYWTLNETRINIVNDMERGDGFIKLRLILDTFTPNFSHFNISINGKPFLLKEESELDWVVVKGENILVVQAVNSFGKYGRPASIEFILI